MKVALVTDLHAGARDGIEAMNDYFMKFYDEVFFPYLESNDIQDIVILGDVFDRRKFINFNILSQWRTHVFSRLEAYNTKIIQGNHDIYWRNSNDVSGLKEILGAYDVEIIDKPALINYDGVPIALCPWILDNNSEECIRFINEVPSKILMAHLEIVGFEQYKGLVNMEAGFKRDFFGRFDVVLSGHYHYRSKQDNIQYLGTPYPIIWSDYTPETPHGFHIMDTAKRSLKFVENPHQIFHHLRYNDEGKTFEQIMENQDLSKYKGTFVKVIVEKKTNHSAFDLFLDALQKENPIEVQPVENGVDMDNGEEYVDETKDMLTILVDYVDKLNIDTVHKPKLIELMRKTYTQTFNMES